MIHYEIKSGDTLIYNSFRVNANYAATNIRYVEELNKVPHLSFDLPINNPVMLEVMKDIVEMYRDGTMIFRGRVTQRRKKFDKSIGYTVEGDLGFLHDILVRPYPTTSTTEAAFFASFFGNNSGLYNGTATRKFTLGTNQGNTDADSAYIQEDDSYPDCYDFLMDHIDVYNGGYVKTRHVLSGGVWTHYIDFIKELNTGSQKILYAKNILDINDDDDGRDIVTRYIPLGKTVDKERVTVKSVAGNNDYISASTEALNDYGVIERRQDYSEVEEADTLKTYAEQDMDALHVDKKKRSLKIKAVDMSIVGDDQPLEIGWMYEVYSHPHGIEYTGPDDKKQLQRVELDLNNPEKNYYYFGNLPTDGMRRIQMDRARADDTRDRVLEEASYCNAIGVESSTAENYFRTYETKHGGSRSTKGCDLTTSCGKQLAVTPTPTSSVRGARLVRDVLNNLSWERVKLFENEDTALTNIKLTIQNNSKLTFADQTDVNVTGSLTVSVSGNITGSMSGAMSQSNGVTLNIPTGSTDSLTINGTQQTVSAGSLTVNIAQHNVSITNATLSNVSGATLTVGAGSKLTLAGHEVTITTGTLTADIEIVKALNERSNLYKATATVTIGKTMASASYVATATDPDGAVIGCSIQSIEDATATVTLFAIGNQSQNVLVSVVAIGTETEPAEPAEEETEEE